MRTRTIRLGVAGVIGLALSIGVLTAGAGARRVDGPRATAARAPSADCRPFAATPCLLPFPNNLFTRPDHTTPTGLRVALPAAAMPVNTAGVRIGTAEYDRNDGFAPGSDVVLHIPGLDNPRALERTAAAGLLDMGKSLDRSQPIVIIDEATGARQLIWSELDANATSPQTTDLLIHPGKDFTDGHTYVVALRDLRTATGHLIAAPSWFALLRDNHTLPPAERSQAARYKRIFTALAHAGIARANLYEAWDFTVGSEKSLTSRLLAIRNHAFAQLGDTNLADGVVQGHAPAFTVTSSSELSPQVRDVQGTFVVPCYLITCGPSAGTGFHYSSHALDALPTQIPGNVATAQFDCIVPSSAGNPTPARISLYGHGLLGSRTEVETSYLQTVASTYNIVFCATDWWGLAQGDVSNDISALKNLNGFPGVVDRLQQGVLNFLYLGRLMDNPAGLASDMHFQVAGHSALDTSHLYYDGNSQGGIEGGLTTAVSPDVRRAVLGVTGLDYGGLLLQRSTDFADYKPFLYGSYPDLSLHPLILDLMQQLWDRGDPDGYAQFMTSDPLPDTPSHVVLMQTAYGDHQVSMYAAAVEARTIGAAVEQPALDLNTNRVRDKNLFYGLPAIRSYPFSGSAWVIWDSGPGRVQPPPVTNTPPVDSSTNIDPHEDVRRTPAAQAQLSAFLEPNGAVVQECSGRPCHTYVYTP